MLIKDLDRMNDLLVIARNLLAGNTKAQNLAAEEGFDIQVLKYIDMCVRVNARGYDGDNRVEAQWANVVSACKSASLQWFLPLPLYTRFERNSECCRDRLIFI